KFSTAEADGYQIRRRRRRRRRSWLVFSDLSSSSYTIRFHMSFKSICLFDRIMDVF
ncbi:unnamed protein product, partial [Musa acuminata subsp. burmannicoides]